jgi:hypothetical protein
VEFCPVKKAVKGLLVFLAQPLAKLLPLSMFLFQKITERHNCPAHISSKALKGPDPILKPTRLKNTHHVMSCQENPDYPPPLSTIIPTESFLKLPVERFFKKA